MKIVDTDNYGRDYPDEKTIASGIKRRDHADVMCEALNVWAGEHSERFFKVEEDSYVLQPGFDP